MGDTLGIEAVGAPGAYEALLSGRVRAACFYVRRHTGLARAHSGQATVEGAFLIPIILMLLLLLIQPGILLYDRMVMNGAAAEGCRLLATRSADGAEASAYEEFVRRRLGAIPEQENFHVHESGCSWEISLQGNEGDSQVAVGISHKVKALPLVELGAQALGVVDEEGCFSLAVEVAQPSRSEWVVGNDQGLDPAAWVRREGEQGADRNG